MRRLGFLRAGDGLGATYGLERRGMCAGGGGASRRRTPFSCGAWKLTRPRNIRGRQPLKSHRNFGVAKLPALALVPFPARSCHSPPSRTTAP
jgi:hypothetical protein